MAINKVVYAGQTLIDLTNDTVSPETLAKGATAHDKSGSRIIGSKTDNWDEIVNKPFEEIDNFTLVNQNGVLKVNTTNDAEGDNTLPITSAGVQTIVGNIKTLLEII